MKLGISRLRSASASLRFGLRLGLGLGLGLGLRLPLRRLRLGHVWRLPKYRIYTRGTGPRHLAQTLAAALLSFLSARHGSHVSPLEI